jgi:hypothetical protein
MKRSLLNAFAIGTMFMVFGLFIPAAGNAEVRVNIAVPLPRLVISAPPALVVIPGSYVYYPPDVNMDIFFFHGHWYRPHRGGWYIADGYNGPWRAIRSERVPRAVFGIQPGFRSVSPRYERIPYSQVHQNWRAWERDRRWDRRGDERGEGREHAEHERRDHNREREHDR